MKKIRTARLRHRPLFLEGLEQRAMLAGNVTAAVRGGTLFVRGNGEDNAVVIQQTGANRFTVVGAAASDTTINGRAEGTAFVANGVRNFDIDLGGGDDSLGVSNSDTFLIDLETEMLGGPTAAQGDIADALTIRGFANIRLGDGDDALGLQLRAGSSILINTGAGSDAAVVEGSTATYLLVQADTGNQATDGDDFVRIRGVDIVDSRGRQTGAIVVNTLAGDDTIVLADDSAVSIIANAGVGGTVNGATDVDTVSGVGLNARGAVIAYGGAGNDSLAFTDVTASTLLLIGGNGNDAIVAGRVDVDVATLLGEGGHDSVTVDDTFNVEDPTLPVDPTDPSFIGIVLHIDTGAGNDVVDVNSNGALLMDIGNMNVVMGDGEDSADLIGLTLAGNLHIDMGAGDDGGAAIGSGLVLADVDVAGFLNAFLGSGNDTADVSNTTAAGGSRARFFGGPGFDSFTDGGGNGEEGTDFFLFEFEEVLEGAIVT